MGSDYQFPRSLSSSKVREPSFSLYLTDDDRCRVVKLVELTRSTTEQNGRVSVDGEINVFSADKYFNGVQYCSQRQQPKETGLQRCAVKKNDMATAFSPVRSKVSLGTPSIRSESSWHSHSALLHRVSTPVQQKKTLWSSFSCKCSCASKKSIEVDDQHHKRVALQEPIRSGMNRADQLLEVGATLLQKPWMTDRTVVLCPSAETSLLDKGPASPVSSTVENLPPKIKKSVTDSISSIHNSFGVPAIGKTRKFMSHERILSLLHWGTFSSGPEDVYIPPGISVEYYSDAESDASSDLFEIDSFTRNDRIPSLSDQIPDAGASGYTTPTTFYAPRK